MTYEIQLDDTQPRVINIQPGVPFSGDDEEVTPNGPGCRMIGLITFVLLLMSLAIVALSAAAGWTSGQREANTIATQTQNFAINEQIERIPTDIEMNNLVFLDARLQYLATLTPGVFGIEQLILTGTALYEANQPTATFTPTPTQEVTEAVEVTADAVQDAVTPVTSGNGQNLAGLLQEAEIALNTGDYQNAIRYLNAISGLDATFERNTVQSMLGRALNDYAMQLYQSNQPAAANLIVNQAEDLGLLSGSLSYERYAAQLYLTASAGAAAGNPNAIAQLQEIINLGPNGRYYTPAREALYGYYVRNGDAYLGSGDSCTAARQYQLARGVFASGVADGKYNTAANQCANATPTPDPNAQVAPIFTPDPNFVPLGQ